MCSMEGVATHENYSRIDDVDHQRRPTCNDLAVEYGLGRGDANSVGTPTPRVLPCDSRTADRRMGETTLLARLRRGAEEAGGVHPPRCRLEVRLLPATESSLTFRRKSGDFSLAASPVLLMLKGGTLAAGTDVRAHRPRGDPAESFRASHPRGNLLNDRVAS